MCKRECSDDVIMNDSTLIKNYVFKRKIGQGCFGKIFQVINCKSKQMRALKIQIAKKQDWNQYTMLELQYDTLQILKKVKGVPKVFTLGNWSLGKYMEIQLLCQDLSEYTTANINLQKIELFEMTRSLIKVFQGIHSKNIIHRDVKAQNLMKNEKGQYYIIDFGISKIYSKQTKKSIRKGFVGTPRYASLRAHMGLQQSFKDDLESLFYVIAHIHYKMLPWMKLAQNKNRIDIIMNIKKQKSQLLFSKMGKPFYQGYKYITQKQHGDYIDYQYLLSLFPKGKHKSINTPLISPLQTVGNNNRLAPNEKLKTKNQRRFTISSNQSIIKLSKSANTVGKIVINWVNKQAISSDFSNEGEDQFEEQPNCISIKVFECNKNDKNSQSSAFVFSSLNEEFNEDCDIQPILPTIHSFSVRVFPH